MKEKIEIIIKFFLGVLTGLVIVSIFFALYGLFQVAILNKSYASYFGYSLFEVESGSMSPTINVKDMVVVEKTSDIKKNDIITYKVDNSFVTHRVVEVEKNKIIAKGDYNNYEDKTIPRKDVIGKVVKVFPKFGVWKRIMLSPIVLIAIFFTMLLFGLGLSYEDTKKTKKKKMDKFSLKKLFSKERINSIKKTISFSKDKEFTEADIENCIDVPESVDEVLLRKTINIDVKKKWNDNNNQDGLRPKSITVRVLKNNEIIDSKELTKEDNWEYTFKDFFKYEDGYEDDSNYEIKYTIDEVMVPGYKKTISGFDITNTHNPKKMNIAGKINWDDINDGKRPKSVVVKLMKNGKLVDSKNVSEDNGWKYTFINLYKYDSGKEIQYTIEEDQVQGYNVVVSGFDITNVNISDTTLQDSSSSNKKDK